MYQTTWKGSLETESKTKKVFLEDFADYLNIGMMSVADDELYRKADIDYVSQIGNSYEIKTFRDKDYISLEEMSVKEWNTLGWIYTSKTNYFIFVSAKSRTMLILKNDIRFKKWWNENKEKYPTIEDETNRDGKIWHSSHKNIPLKDLDIIWYKRNFKAWT